MYKNRSLFIWGTLATLFLGFVSIKPWLVSGLIKAAWFNAELQYLIQISPEIKLLIAQKGISAITDVLVQIPIRMLLALGIIWSVFRKEGLLEIYSQNAPPKIEVWLRVIAMAALLFGLELCLDIENQRIWASYYQPKGVMLLLPDIYPTFQDNLWNSFLLAVCFMGAFTLPLVWVFWAGGGLLFIIQAGYAGGLGKVEHTYATFFILLMLIPLLVYEFNQGAPKLKFLFLIKLSVTLVYAWAAMEKLLFSGFSWATAEHLNSFLEMQHLNPIMLPDWLLTLGMWLVLCFQLSMPLAAFYKPLSRTYFILGIGFHLATWLFLGAGGWANPWFIALSVLLL